MTRLSSGLGPNSWLKQPWGVMSTAVDHITERLTAPASLPASTGREHSWTDTHHIQVEGSKYSGKILDILSSRLEGCGRVDLVKIRYKFHATAADQFLEMGFREVGSSITTSQVAGKANGVVFTSNPHTYGKAEIGEMVPEDSFSMQLKPPPADLPILELCFEKSSELKLNLSFDFRVHGIRNTYGVLKC